MGASASIYSSSGILASIIIGGLAAFAVVTALGVWVKQCVSDGVDDSLLYAHKRSVSEQQRRAHQQRSP